MRDLTLIEGIAGTVARDLGGYVAEAHAARLEFLCVPDESGGYASDDPKHPTYHERMSALWDNREKV